jgi:hypothetical protein
MALLNPPEIRLSVMSLTVSYLARRRGQKDDQAHLINTVAPPSLTADGKHQLDARVNLTAALEIGLLVKDGDEIRLPDGVAALTKKGGYAIAKHVRSLVLADSLNRGAWGSQMGARDLTNALAWFLTFSAEHAPARMEGAELSAHHAQEADFGPRQGGGERDEDASGWPISNLTRWNTFQRWACSLGFAWRSPSGRLVPDPAVAVGESIQELFDGTGTLSAEDFVLRLGRLLPVLDTGRYRTFVAENWRRDPGQPNQLSSATTDALSRLARNGVLSFEDRADAPRYLRADGTTFSHVSLVSSR